MNIEQIISLVMHETCWRAWRGAQYTVYLEFGDKHPNVEGQSSLKKGTYTLGLTSCPWAVYRDGMVIFDTDSTFTKIDESLGVFIGKQLIDIQLDQMKHEAMVTFSDNILLKIYYSHPKDEWDILTPDNEVVISSEIIKISASEKHQ